MITPEAARIYEEYHGKVMGYIRARVNSWADAEDLCADVFEKICRNLESYDRSKASVSTWVFSITRNTVIDFFRRSKPTEELDENIPEDSEVDENLLQRETLQELAAALSRLDSQLRDIVVLRYHDGLPLTEIASRLGISYGAVKLRHQKALDLLRASLGDRLPLG